jgi:hypothetical protein
MIKIQILTKCEECDGGYLPVGEAKDAQGRTYTRYVPCSNCNGSGKACKWISLEEFAILLRQMQCPHNDTFIEGGMHFVAGDIAEDFTERCADCGVILDGQVLGDIIDLP